MSSTLPQRLELGQVIIDTFIYQALGKIPTRLTCPKCLRSAPYSQPIDHLPDCPDKDMS